MLEIVPAELLEEENLENTEAEEKDTPSESQSEQTEEQEEGSQPHEEESKDESKETAEDNTPFHKRWKKREEKLRMEYEDRFNTLQAELESLKSPKTEEKEGSVNIPSWFIGDEEAYKDYVSDREALKKEAIEAFREQERMEKEAKKKELETYESNYDDQILAIETATGRDLTDSDKNKLYNFIVNELSEDERPLKADGSYNLHAAYRMFRSQYPAEETTNQKKKLADMTIDGNPSSNDGEEKVWAVGDFTRNWRN
jgi:hypothetical protein